MLKTIESDNPFDVLFLDFCEPMDIPDQDGSRKILTLMDCMTVFGLGSAIFLKEIKSDQAARWGFGNFFVPFGLPKMIVVDANGTKISPKAHREAWYDVISFSPMADPRPNTVIQSRHVRILRYPYRSVMSPGSQKYRNTTSNRVSESIV